MKILLILAAFISILGESLARESENSQVDLSDLRKVLELQMEDLNDRREGQFHLECFNDFLPLINSIALKAKNDSHECVFASNFEIKRRGEEFTAMVDARVRIEEEIKNITFSLADCSNKTRLQFFICMRHNAHVNKDKLNSVKQTSTELAAKFQKFFKDIDFMEHQCIIKAVDTARKLSVRAYTDLKACVHPVKYEHENDDELEEEKNDKLT